MNRQRLFRGLRIAWIAGFGILCLLLIVLWVRSHQRCEYFYTKSGNRITILGSNAGTAYLLRRTISGQVRPRNWGWKYNDTAVAPTMSHYQRAAGETFIVVPYWLLIALVGAMAFGPWIRWSNRFSLRTLLIATTLIAMALGIIISAS